MTYDERIDSVTRAICIRDRGGPPCDCPWVDQKTGERIWCDTARAQARGADYACLNAFIAEVERRAEENMLKTGKLEGVHYAAMKQVMTERE